MMSNLKPFGLRIPPELKKWLEDRAHENGRSLNSEILHIIKVEKQTEFSKEGA